MIATQIALALAAAACSNLIMSSIASQPRYDRQERIDVMSVLVFILVLAAERGWYS